MDFVNLTFRCFLNYGLWMNRFRSFARCFKSKRIFPHSHLHRQTLISTHSPLMTKTTQMKTTTTTIWFSTETEMQDRGKIMERRNTISLKTCTKNWRSRSSEWESLRQLHRVESHHRTYRRHPALSKLRIPRYFLAATWNRLLIYSIICFVLAMCKHEMNQFLRPSDGQSCLECELIA